MNAYKIEIVFKSGSDESFIVEAEGDLKKVSDNLFECIEIKPYIAFVTTNDEAVIFDVDDISRLAVKEFKQ